MSETLQISRDFWRDGAVFVAGSHLGPWYMPRSFLDGESPAFPGLADELPSGAALDHPLIPIVWKAAR